MSYFHQCVTRTLAGVIALSFVSVAWGQHGGGYGWPQDDCGSGACGGGGDASSLSANWHQLKADSHLIAQRNAAWPLPFSCWDRSTYYCIWNQQYATGLQVAHTLTSDCFDANTQELNRVGETRVAWIMQNSPAADRRIFVHEESTGPVMDQRLASVRSVVDRWYGHLGGAEIAASSIMPNQILAAYQTQINEMYNNSMPQPVIPVQVGTSVQQAAAGN